MITPTPTTEPTPDSTPNPVQAARALLKECQEKFAVFRDYQPLAIGIDKQLAAHYPEISRKVLRIALGIHTKSQRYLKAMEKASVRLDLDGKQADEVTQAQRDHAAEMLRERFKKMAEQRKAQREAEEATRKHAEKLNQLAAKFSK